MKQKIGRSIAIVMAVLMLFMTVGENVYASQGMDVTGTPEYTTDDTENTVPGDNGDTVSGNTGTEPTEEESESSEPEELSQEESEETVTEESEETIEETVEQETLSELVATGESSDLVSGDCSLNQDGSMTYVLSADYKLTITGTGEMKDYNTYSAPWYQYYNQITAVEISEGVTSIGKGTFFKLEKIESISIPASVETIGESAFESCSALTSVDFAENSKLETIGRYAFYRCTQLVNIEIPTSVMSIAFRAFYECKALNSLVIPTEVTNLEGNAFEGCSALTSITIPASVTKMGTGVFSGCSLLETVNFAEGSALLALPDYTFQYCSALTSFTLPADITRIGANAFRNCTSLTEFEVPASVTQIGGSAFYGCSKLQQVTFATNEEGASEVTSIGSSAFKNTALTSITIPDTVKSVGSYCFEECKQLTGVVLPTSLTKLETATFRKCSVLETITIPAKVTTIDGDAFYDCTALKTVTFVDETKITSLGTYAFGKCSSLETIVIPSSLTEIPQYLFTEDSALKSVTLPEKITKINQYAFNKCSSLTEVRIPVNVTAINDSAFRECINLEKVTFLGDNVTTLYNNAFNGCKKLAVITLPSGLTTINNSVFRECTSLTEITIPAGVTKIEKDAFLGSSGLKKVTFSATDDKLTEIGQGAFCDCTLLEDFEIPATVKTIGSGAFKNCSSLQSATIPAVLPYIDTDTFSGCTSLKKVSFRKDAEGNTALTKIYQSAFNESGLTEITIPASVDEIRWKAFYKCQKLITVNFEEESALATVGTDVFNGCSALTTITIPAKLTKIDKRFLQDCTTLTTVNFSKDLEGNSALKRIEYEGFRNASSLKDITLPKSIEYFDTGAFISCSSLENVNIEKGCATYYSIGGIVYNVSDDKVYFKPAANSTGVTIPKNPKIFLADYYRENKEITEITIPASVEEIEAYAFYGCTNLQKVTFAGNKCVKIGQGAFNGCSSLTSITIPAVVTQISPYTFKDCEKLTSVKFATGSSCISFGKEAFKNCSSLKTFTIPKNVSSFYCSNINATSSEDTFYGCSSLEKVLVEAGNSTFFSDNGIVFKKDTGKAYFKPACNTGSTAPKLVEGVVELTPEYFSYNKEITSVTIPASVEIIKDSAFYGCSNLKTVTFAKGSKLREIGNNAFRTCSSLSKITLPETLESIGYYAFDECSALTTMNIPASVTSIEFNAFNDCTSLQTVDIKCTVLGEYMFENCTALTKVTLADGLKSISRGSFYKCKKLTDITIPDSVETISSFAFCNCESLSNVHISTSCTKIEADAFNGCKSLSKIELPSTLTTIEESAFANTVITSIKIPKNVNVLYASCFYGCKLLEEIIVEEGNENFKSTDGNLYKKTESGWQLYYCPPANPVKQVVIPEEAETIDASAFQYNTKVSEIVIPASISVLPDYCFKGCTNLRVVTVEAGSSLSSIPSHAFDGCSSLRRVEFLGDSQIASIGAYAFAGCDSLEKISFENNTTDIAVGSYAFKGNASFKGLYSNGSAAPLGNIGSQAFYHCYNLAHVCIGASCETIHKEAFLCCNALQDYKVADGNTKFNAVDGVLYATDYALASGTVYDKVLVFYPGGRGGNYTVADGTTAIHDYAFYKNTKLRSVNIPATVKYIGTYAFYEDNALWKIGVTNDSALEKISDYAFYNCQTLEEIELGKAGASLKYIGNSAFYDCNKIVDIGVFSCLESIGNYAFYDCDILEVISLPDTVSNIGEYAFKYCDAIKTVKIPANLGSVKRETFYSCDSLETVDFTGASSLQSIEREAFDSCSSLRSIDFTGADSLSYFGFSSFCDTGLEAVEVPEGVTKLDSFVFSDCSKLKTVVLPESLVTFSNGGAYKNSPNKTGSYLFAYDSALESVTIKNANLEMGRYMFYRCDKTVKIYGVKDSKAQEYVENYTEESYCRTSVEFHEIGSPTTSPTEPVTEESGTFGENEEYLWSLDEDGKLTIEPNPDKECSGVLTGVDADGPWSTVNRKVLEICLAPGIVSIDNNEFGSFDYLEKVTIPETVKEIPEFAFYYCSLLKKVSLPSTLTYIGYYAFAYCDDLEEITIPAGVEKIGQSAFASCNHLKAITVAPGNEHYIVVNGVLYEILKNEETGETTYKAMIMVSNQGSEDEIVTIPAEACDISAILNRNAISGFAVDEGNHYYAVYDEALYSKDGKILYRVPYTVEGEFVVRDGVREIAENAFYGCKSITGIKMSDSVTMLDDYAFYNCSSLESIELSANIIEIPAYCFGYCRSLLEIKLPAKLEQIGYDAFYHTDSLNAVEIPDTVTYLGGNAFEYSGINKLKLSENITQIAYATFRYCSNLTEVVIPDKVKSINDGAFNNCYSLTSVTMGSNVTDIYYYESTLLGTSMPFNYCGEGLTIYGVKDSYAESYFAQNKYLAYRPDATSYKTYATFVPDNMAKYTIKYMLNEKLGENNADENPGTYRYEDELITLYPAQKPGYLFGGWYLDKACTDEITVISPQSAKNYVLYPKWYKLHEVSLMVEEASWDTIHIGDGMPLGKVEAPKKDGSDFVCWQTAEGVEYGPDTCVYEDITLYALYEEAGSLKVYAPIASVESGLVENGTGIELSSATLDAEIYYTLDGSVPLDETGNITASGIKYVDAIPVNGEAGDTITITAMARKNEICSGRSIYSYQIKDEGADWGEISREDREYFANAEEVPEGLWITGVPDETVYSGKAITFNVNVYFGKKKLTNGKDYTIKYKNNLAAAESDSKKAPAVTVSGKGNYSGLVTKYFSIKQLNFENVYFNNLYYGGLRIECSDNYPVYIKGKTQKLKVTPYYNGVKLSGKDYTVDYKDDDDYTSAGEHSVEITGKGNCTGTVTYYYEIADAISMKKVSISGFKSKLQYDPNASYVDNKGNHIQEDLVLTYKENGKTKEVPSSCYTVEYSNATQAGTATMTIKGKGGFAGIITKKYTIVGFNIKKVKLEGFQSKMTYTGKEVRQPDVTLTYKDKTGTYTLTKDKDYTVSYINDVKVGKATVIYTGIGRYTGVLKKTYKIQGYDFKKDSMLKKPLIKINVSPKVQYEKSGAKPVVQVIYKGTILVEGKDYKLSYKNNTKYPVAFNKQPTVVITGKGNYTGSLNYTFDIEKSDIGKLQISAKDIMFKEKGGNYISAVAISDVSGKALKAGTDYDCEYTLEEPITLLDGSKKLAGEVLKRTDMVPAGAVVRATVQGKGGYEGSKNTILYRVYATDIGKAKVEPIASKIYTGKAITLTKSDIVVTVDKNAGPLDDSDYEIVSYSKNINKGTAKVKIKGVGNYGGIKEITFKIIDKSFADAEWKK